LGESILNMKKRLLSFQMVAVFCYYKEWRYLFSSVETVLTEEYHYNNNVAKKGFSCYNDNVDCCIYLNEKAPVGRKGWFFIEHQLPII